MKFTLEIALGNEAMSTGADIAGALTQLAARSLAGGTHEASPDEGFLFDFNGNKVGSWTISEDGR